MRRKLRSDIWAPRRLRSTANPSAKKQELEDFGTRPTCGEAGDEGAPSQATVSKGVDAPSTSGASGSETLQFKGDSPAREDNLAVASPQQRWDSAGTSVIPLDRSALSWQISNQVSHVTEQLCALDHGLKYHVGLLQRATRHGASWLLMLWKRNLSATRRARSLHPSPPADCRSRHSEHRALRAWRSSRTLRRRS